MRLRRANAPAAATSLNLPFRPRARLLQLLGDELIGSARLAVFELVKNAYDADAATVTVILDQFRTSSASIVVQDDGEGMTKAVIRDIWLVPGHDHRLRQRLELRRTPKGRLPLGEKGLGRFAVHKLGDRIALVTRARDEPECVVEIDWSALIRKQRLSDATVQVQERDPVVFRGARTGTRITISDLRESNWTRGEVRRLKRQLTSIASPFASRPDSFKVTLDAPDLQGWLDGVPDASTVMKLAPWQFSFRFDSGRFDWTYLFTGVGGVEVERRNLERRQQKLHIRPDREMEEGIAFQRSGSWSNRIVADAQTAQGIGPVDGKFYVFDRDAAVLRRLGETQLIRRYLDENGGVRVYRDGIRVYNYGEPGDDWLGLDLRRVNSPKLRVSRNIVIGAIDLSLESSRDLKEKTNREGFVENLAVDRLKQIVLGALGVLEAERKKDKESIRKLVGRTPETRRVTRPLRRLRKVARRSDQAEELEPLIRQVEREYDELRDGMLRASLSGMGLAIVFHEVEHGVLALCRLIEHGGRRETIHDRARELSRLLGGFNDLLRKGPQKRTSLNKLVGRVIDINRIRFRKHRVRLEPSDCGKDGPVVMANFVFSLALGALNNLLDNAFYWLKTRWPDVTGELARRRIHIKIDSGFDGGAAVIVADNGPGFVDDPEVLTTPFFSRRPEGMGLGLYYANLVMRLGGGHLVFPGAAEAGLPAELDGAVVAMVFPEDQGGD